MTSKIAACLLLMSVRVFAQNNDHVSPFDGSHWGVVLEHPGMKNVAVQKDILYFRDDKSSLHIDLYAPPGLKKDEKSPAIVFLNGIGDDPGEASMKSMEIYRTWPRLVAAQGYIGISMETDGSRVQECFGQLFHFLTANGNQYQIDSARLGVYAASANARESAAYLMSERACPGIKAAVLYYGSPPAGPFRKDLPVFFVVAEGDARRNSYSSLWNEVLENNAPWTIKMASGLPHGFDAFSDNDDARKVVKETLSFWKNHLDPVQAPSLPPSQTRAIVEAGYWGDHSKVVRLMKEWFRENPGNNDPAAFNIYANALMRVKEYAEAETIFKKCLELNPDNNGIRLNLVLISYALDKPGEGEQMLVQYEKSIPPEQFTYFYIANYLYGIAKYSTAIPYYEKALTFEPPAAFMFYNLAGCYARTGEKDKAFLNLNNAVESGQNSKQDYENDANLESLKTDQRWQELLKKLR